MDMIGNFSFLDVVILIGVVLLSMTVHEFMHAFVGHKLGDTTAEDEGRLSLNPLKHVDPLMTVVLPVVTILLFHVPILAAKPVPFNPARLKYDEYGAALLAIAGPLSNLCLAIIAAFLSRFTVSDFVYGVLHLVVTLNVALFVFNMVPIPPLDGSRVLYAFSPDPVRRLLEMVEPFGFVVIFSLILIGGFGDGLVRINQMVLNLLP
jgi:Zn-dependent protease